MALLNYTTKIDADKTASEIAKCLSMHGASKIVTDYEGGILIALSFAIKLNEREIGFKLPCDWRPVLEIITRGKKAPPTYLAQKRAKWEADWRDQAVRTAWRIVKDWVEAQMALVETHMVSTAQVFLPYAVMANGKTLAEHVAESPEFLLDSGQS